MAEVLPFVRRWFDSAFGIPTAPQRDGWTAIASGRDTLIVAPTGSGKTLAAFLWALDHLHRLAEKGGFYEVQAASNRHGVRGWRGNGVRWRRGRRLRSPVGA